MSSPVIILVILSRWAEKPFQGKPFGLKQGQVEWVLKKRDQLNVILICLSSSLSSCLVGQRNLLRENHLGSNKDKLNGFLKKGTSWMPSWYACHHPRHLVSSGGETFSGKTFWATWVPAHARPNSLLPLLLTSSFLMPRLQLERNCEKGLGIVLRISLLWIFSWALPGLELHNAPRTKYYLTSTHPGFQFETITRAILKVWLWNNNFQSLKWSFGPHLMHSQAFIKWNYRHS